MPDKFVLKIPVKQEIIFFLILLGLAVFVRFYHLGADSPHRISFSLGIETDPPQYTVFAHSAVQTGDWNPNEDNRYITYLYSLVSATAWLVFKLFGIGLFQANMVASILSLVSILLFYFIVRKSLGNGVALLALLFMGANYLGVFFGRRPFLENSMNLMFIAALFFLALWEKRILGHFLFGLFFAASVFFGKIIALGFIGVPIIYYLYRLLYLKDRSAVGHAAVMAVGFLAIGVFWFMVIFTPHHEQVTGYVGEQALGLYGLPDALKSPGMFFWKFLTYGKESQFFDRMPAISIASLIIVLALTAQIFRRRNGSRLSPFDNTIFIAIAAWLVSIFLSQMPWNYQPARYQTAMVFPISAMAGSLIAYLYHQRESINWLNRGIVFNIVLLVCLVLFIYHAMGKIVIDLGYTYYFTDYMPYVLLITVPIFIAYVISVWQVKVLELALPPVVRYGAIVLVLTVFLAVQSVNFIGWANNILYTTRQSSRDLGMILSPGAVISGPFGPALAQENELGCLIHIFGTSRPDPDLFKKYPVTHLITEKTNEEVAREFYPELMERAKDVAHYYVNCRKLTVHRIAFISGNPTAFEYLPSNYESAVMFYRRDMPDSGDFYLDRFLSLYPENSSGNILAGYRAQTRGDLDMAIAYYQKAVEFSPTDFNLHYLLGQAYRAKADSTGEESLMDLARQESDLATRLDLGYHEFDEYITEPSEGKVIESFSP